LHGSISLDRRDDTDFPASGFYLRTEVTRGLSGNLSVPGIMTDPSGPGPATPFDEQVTSGMIDARIYRLVGRDATLSFRLVGAGSIDDKPLPPQFQHAFGGAGSLPGYASFSGDCGARNVRVSTGDGSGNMFYPYYGCDRMALFSAEYRGGFDFHWGGFDVWDEEDEDWDWGVSASPNWVVFFDAARGWAHEDSKSRGARDTETLYDVGAGILLGDVGLYTAVPLTGDDRGLRFFVRLGPRF
jgi:outer membrane protein assembly factor BamA